MAEPGVAEQARYLELRLAECRHRPELHAHLIAAYDHNLRVLKAAPSLAAYLEHTDNLFEVCRAQWLDWRYNNLRIYASLGDVEKTRTAAMQYDAGLRATGHADFTAAVCATHVESAEHEANAHAAEGAIELISSAIVDWHVESIPERKSLERDKVLSHWAALRAADPAFTPLRLASYPPYRDRLPLSDSAMHVLSAWLLACIPDADVAAGGSPEADSATITAAVRRSARDYVDRLSAAIGDIAATDAPHVIGPASDATAAYHATYAAIDPNDPDRARARAVYEQIFELERTAGSSTELARDLAEADVYCSLPRAAALDQAHAALRRHKGTPDRHLEHHYRALIIALEACRSPIGVLFETTRAAEYQRVESTWNNLFIMFATASMRATAEYERAPIPEFGERVCAASQAVAELFGTSWDQLLAIPNIAEYFERVVFVAGSYADPTDIAIAERLTLAFTEPYQAAARGALQAQLKAHMQAGGSADIPALLAELRKKPRFTSPGEMWSHLTALYREARGGPEPEGASPDHVVYWRVAIALGDLASAIIAPPRLATVLD